jgi:predicted RND superfamily exporter protein
VRVFDRFVDTVCRHPRVVILALAVVTAFWGSQLRTLRVEIDPDANLPQDHSYIRALHVLEDRFGEKNLVVIGLFPKDGNVFTAPFLAKLQRITQRIATMPGLIRSTYLSLASPLAKAIEGAEGTLLVRPIMEGTPTSSADVAEVRRRAFVTPLYVGTIVAADSSATAIVANFRLTPELTGYPEIEQRLETIVAEENDGTFTAHFGGPVAVLAALAHVTERTVLLFPLAVLVVALIHYEAFRTLQGMLLPLVTAVLAVVWSLGLMGFLRIRLDPFNTTTPILILAVAAGHAVQVLKRYYEEYDRYHDTQVAVRAALRRVGPVMMIAGAIAALSFFSLTVFATATIRNFGMLTGAGIVAALVIELTLIPAVRVQLRPPRAAEIDREARSGRMLEGVLGRVAAVAAHKPATVVTIAILVAGAALAAATRLRVDTSFKRQFGPRHPVRVADDALNASFGGTNTLIFIVEGPAPNALHDPTALAAIADLQRFVETDPAVGKTISIVDFLGQMDRALHDGQSAPAIPDTADLVSQYLFLYSMSGGPEDLDSQIDPDHRSAVVRAFVHRDSTEHGEQLIRRVREHAAKTFPPGYRLQYSGIIASNAALAETMVHGKIFNMLQVAGIIMLVSSLVLRSPVAGLLVAAPLAMAVLVNFGVMGLLGVPLDIMTAPLAAMAVGIGADYAIYFVFRFREELAVSATRELALASTLRTSGKAIVYVSSAISGGYLVLCTSGFVYHRELSMMIALAMTVSSIAAITLLPALLVWVQPRFLFGETSRLVDRRMRRSA